jgi:hypothetical protein
VERCQVQSHGQSFGNRFGKYGWHRHAGCHTAAQAFNDGVATMKEIREKYLALERVRACYSHRSTENNILALTGERGSGAKHERLARHGEALWKCCAGGERGLGL